MNIANLPCSRTGSANKVKWIGSDPSQPPQPSSGMSFKFVHFCFSCENYLYGKTCIKHHAKECCSQNQSQLLPPTLPLPNTGSNRNHTWIKCNTCARQSNLATCQVPLMVAPHKWARLLVLLFKKHQAIAPVKQCSRRTTLNPEVMSQITSFLG